MNDSRLRTGLRAAVVAALVIGALTGCGSGRLGTEEYLARGNLKCQAVTTTANRFGRPTTSALIARKTRAIDVQLRQLTSMLRRLRTPRPLEGPARKFVGLVDRRIEIDDQLAAFADAGNAGSMIAAGLRRDPVDIQVNAAAVKVGFRKCVMPSR